MAYEQKLGQHQVPILVQKSAEFIREHGVAEEGIFRLPGQDNLVRQLRDAFDAGERPSFDRYRCFPLCLPKFQGKKQPAPSPRAQQCPAGKLSPPEGERIQQKAQEQSKGC